MFSQLFAEYTGLAVLLVLWAAFLFGGFILGRVHDGGKRRMPTWTRMASSLTLVVAAWSFAIAPPRPAVALLVAVGMTLGFVGDLFMARLLPARNHVLGGIGSFGLGHVAYIAAFVQIGAFSPGVDRAGQAPAWWVLPIWWMIGAVGWYIVVFRGQKPTPLHYAALIYALLLSSTAGIATMLALSAPPLYTWTAAGAALFLLSDLILAGELFNDLNFPLIGDVIWLTYGPAQMLIVYSMIAAVAAG